VIILSSTNKTPNYGLNQWVGTDLVKREDFNSDNVIIDTKLKENATAISDLSASVDSHKADDMKHIDYAVASGTNTYTATITNITVLTEGLSVKIKFTNANTGASTLNLNSLGVKTIQKGNGNALSSGNIKAGQICHLVYTGSVFQLLGEGGEYGTVTASDVRSTKTVGTENGVVQGTLDLTNLIASNIINGITIGGVTGNVTIQSLGGKRWVSGEFTLNFGVGYQWAEYTATGLYSFEPTMLLLYSNDTNLVKSAAAKCEMIRAYGVVLLNSDRGGENNNAIYFKTTPSNGGFSVHATKDNSAINYSAATAAVVKWLAIE
jgi:hypothetical protein